MINKIKSISKKQWCIGGGVVLILAALAVTTHFVCRSDSKNTPKGIEDIKVTETEMQLYRERIGTDMDIKKTYLVLFEEADDCIDFIETHGADDDPTAAGIGIVPMMENGYYNIVGKKSLEETFDLLKDGEYSEVPIIYSGMYCYIKRIGIESPIKDDEALKELIRNEKYQKLRKAGE